MIDRSGGMISSGTIRIHFNDGVPEGNECDGAMSYSGPCFVSYGLVIYGLGVMGSEGFS